MSERACQLEKKNYVQVDLKMIHYRTLLTDSDRPTYRAIIYQE